jgi:periplasmic protein CpxP/Spy
MMIMKTVTKTLMLLLLAFLSVQSVSAQDDKMERGGKAKQEEKFKAVAAKLNLTADQQTKLKAVLMQHKTDMKALREANKDKTKDEKRKVMLEQMKKLDTQISAILDSKQLEQYKQMKADKKAEMKKKREEHMKMREEMEGDEGIF